jgi:hypothetical protein
MIRTAIPFGYAFIALFLITIFIGGCLIFILGWCFRSRIAKWSGLGIAAIVVALIVSNEMFESSIEWNPTLKSDADIIGTWSGGGQTVTLAPNMTFRCQSPSTNYSGIWSRDDWNLYLRSDSYTNTMRFITFREQYRLMTRPLGDPDEWDGDLGLKHQEDVR